MICSSPSLHHPTLILHPWHSHYSGIYSVLLPASHILQLEILPFSIFSLISFSLVIIHTPNINYYSSLFSLFHTDVIGHLTSIHKSSVELNLICVLSLFSFFLEVMTHISIIKNSEFHSRQPCSLPIILVPYLYRNRCLLLTLTFLSMVPIPKRKRILQITGLPSA